jgi:formate dehydrogenase iron-sulfur subunit
MITMTPPSLRDFAPNLLGEFVAEALGAQATLTAVDRFSSWHDGKDAHAATPELAPWYRDLIPLQAPGPGEQYAFEVDLDRCSGCKACVTACHNLNGLDAEEGESFRDVGLLLSPDGQRSQQHITSACHHCLQPGCADGCPVLAYEKEPDTGVVRHLDDQCIGCEYCVLKCPYDVPKYHHGKGIVRKCDLCVGRLRAGEAPACVQACPTKAIRVAVVSTRGPVVSETNSTQDGFLLPGAPDASFTQPTTRYISKQTLSTTMVAGNSNSVKPEAAHAPLAATLVVSQFAFGLLWAHLAHRFAFEGGTFAASWILGLLPVTVMGAAMVVSLTHLGRPHLAWKAWLNWRKSWLSREIIAFGGFMGLASLVGLFGILLDSPWASALQSPLPLARPASAFAALRPWIEGLALLFSALGIATSSMVYIDTPRALWRRSATFWRFALTALGSGAALYALAAVALGEASATGTFLTLAAVGHGIKWAIEANVLRFFFQEVAANAPSPQLALKRSAQILMGPKRHLFALRSLLGFSGFLVAIMTVLILPPQGGPGFFTWAGAGWVALSWVLADFLERHLFFTTAASPRMPGTL